MKIVVTVKQVPDPNSVTALEADNQFVSADAVADLDQHFLDRAC